MKKKTQAQRILDEAVRNYGKATNQKKVLVGPIAKKCGLPYSSVYNPIHNNRKTNAETFLKILGALGALKKVKEGLKINIPKAGDYAS